MALTFVNMDEKPVLIQATDHLKDPCLKSRPDMLGPRVHREALWSPSGNEGLLEGVSSQVTVWLVESGVCKARVLGLRTGHPRGTSPGEEG